MISYFNVQIIENVTIDKLVILNKVKDWCRLPYPRNKNGCPNYGCSKDCPPKAPFLWEFFDLDKPIGFIVISFDLYQHALHWLELRPRWSMDQARNSRYWQKTIYSKMDKIFQGLSKGRGYNRITTRPEAYGLQVFRTMGNIGFKLYARPGTQKHPLCYKVAMFGFKR
jgi:hypothetical protein